MMASSTESKARGGAGSAPLKVAAVLLVWWVMAILGTTEAVAGGGQININTASVKELEQLPLLGESRARAIVSYRQKRGHFVSLDEIRQVPDIGDKTFQAIRPYLILSGTSTLTAARADPPATATVRVLPTIITRPGEVRLLTDQDYYPTLQSMIGHATQSIDLAMFVFKTTKSSRNRAAALVQDLVAARKRGIIINILLEKSGYDHELNKENRKIGAYLQKQGLAVRFDSERTTTHAKVVVIDRRYCLLGSHNFTTSALSYNHEVSLLVDNQALANELLEYMQGIR